MLRPAAVMLGLFSLLTGLAYPLLVTGIAQLAFPGRANGSLIAVGGKTVGSRLIGQPFTDPQYFWGRPSATTPFPCNAQNSGGSNLGPLNPDLQKAVRTRIDALRAADPENQQPIPVDLVTASGSGLDPHISLAAADYQGERVARLRGLEPIVIRRLIASFTEGRQYWIFGEPRVNVLRLNRALDAVKTTAPAPEAAP